MFFSVKLLAQMTDRNYIFFFAQVADFYLRWFFSRNLTFQTNQFYNTEQLKNILFVILVQRLSHIICLCFSGGGVADWQDFLEK